MGYTYVMSDLHGHYEEYLRMLEKIDFSEEDTLYVLGDLVDRGPKPISLVLDLMKRPNCICIVGNHEEMACTILPLLGKEITEETILNFSEDYVADLANWISNGADPTVKEFFSFDKNIRDEVMEFILEMDIYDEITVGDKQFVLVHAGLGKDFDPDRQLWEYDFGELIWDRPDFDARYFDDKYVIVGHTPTQFIKSENNKHPGFIFHGNNIIDIDCGFGIDGGRLGCLRLDDFKEFYVE